MLLYVFVYVYVYSNCMVQYFIWINVPGPLFVDDINVDCLAIIQLLLVSS